MDPLNIDLFSSPNLTGLELFSSIGIGEQSILPNNNILGAIINTTSNNLTKAILGSSSDFQNIGDKLKENISPELLNLSIQLEELGNASAGLVNNTTNISNTVNEYGNQVTTRTQQELGDIFTAYDNINLNLKNTSNSFNESYSTAITAYDSLIEAKGLELDAFKTSTLDLLNELSVSDFGKKAIEEVSQQNIQNVENILSQSSFFKETEDPLVKELNELRFISQNLTNQNIQFQKEAVNQLNQEPPLKLDIESINQLDNKKVISNQINEQVISNQIATPTELVIDREKINLIEKTTTSPAQETTIIKETNTIETKESTSTQSSSLEKIETQSPTQPAQAQTQQVQPPIDLSSIEYLLRRINTTLLELDVNKMPQ